jgi:hypothetical protein
MEGYETDVGLRGEGVGRGVAKKGVKIGRGQKWAGRIFWVAFFLDVPIGQFLFSDLSIFA